MVGPVESAPYALDPLSGTLVVSVPSRQRRPAGGQESCPVCPGGQEWRPGSGPFSFPNRWPGLPGDRCEVVVYARVHEAGLASLSTAELTQVVELWTERTEKLVARPDVDYVLIFENRGSAAGATLAHPHGQIYAYDMVPPAALSELDSERCALCASGTAAHVVEELDGWTAAAASVARWPYELLITPRKHVSGLPDLDDDDRAALARLLGRSLRRIDGVLGADSPLLLWIHQLPGRSELSALAHLHVHLAPLFRAPDTPRLIAAGEYGSGIVFNTVGAREAAEALRGVTV